MTRYSRIETAQNVVTENVMPISLFPNATQDKCEEMFKIMDKEFALYSQNSAIVTEADLRIAAALCQAVENIFHSQTIRAQHTFSPKAVQELTQLLKSCT